MGRLLLALALALGLGRTAAAENGSHLLLLNLDLEFETPADRDAAVERTIAVLDDRLDELVVGAPAAVWRYPADFLILVGVPDTADIERVRSVVTRAGRLEFRLVDDGVSLTQAMAGDLPASLELLPDAEKAPNGEPVAYYIVHRSVSVSGENLIDAQPSFQNDRPVLSFRFDSAGARRFGETTQENVGRRFAIVLDGEVISAPVIRSAILGGSGIIDGSFTVQAASDLATLLQSGTLPGPLSIVKQHWIVGPPPVQPTTLFQFQ